jgi:flavin reductase (DIM6/NTAB) family NADH-FMN oxidoreductase RutF
MGAFPTGVTIVTTLDERGQPKGLTSNAVCSVSPDPPLLLVCVDQCSNTLPALQHTRRFVVNYLVAGRGELSNLFASKELVPRRTSIITDPCPAVSAVDSRA